MQRFAQLYTQLDATTSTRAKVDALVAYLRDAPADDAAWGVYFLAGGKPRRGVSSTLLKQWAARAAGIDDWLFDASYDAVGDLAETIAHLLPPPVDTQAPGLAVWMHERLLPWRHWPLDEQERCFTEWLRGLDWAGRFLLIKLIGGAFRVGMSRQLVIRGLAEHAGLPATLVAQRMMGYTDTRRLPTAQAFLALIEPAPSGADLTSDDPGLAPAQESGQPFPFFLAHALPPDLPADPGEFLGPVSDWLAEWKFDGIRAQVVRRASRTWVWSRGEDLITEQFPEIAAQADLWPDGTILDGEIIVRQEGEFSDPPQGHGDGDDGQASSPWLLPLRPAPFAKLQLRLGRRSVGRKLLADCPAAFLAYDVLAWQGRDVRGEPTAVRRALLEDEVAPRCLVALSPLVTATDWAGLADARSQARALGVEGLMLKHADARYGVGRTKSQGTWWKWKVDPLSVDAVLIYAQAGHGRRASLFTDYTFALWNRPPRDAQEARAVLAAIERREPPDPAGLQLVSFAKAYSGLDDEEIRAVDRIVRRDTLERFGPVCSLRPTQVFEIGFEGINLSGRHKSGVAVRFPRILRWRHDKPLHEADTLEHLRQLAGLPEPAAGSDGPARPRPPSRSRASAPPGQPSLLDSPPHPQGDEGLA